MAQHSIPVDLANPGQVFACHGLAETAETLLGGATGAFQWGESNSALFWLAANGGDNPVEQVLRFLQEAKVVALTTSHEAQTEMETKWKVACEPVDTGVFPFPEPASLAKLPAKISDNEGHSIVIDHWGDETRRDNVKFWAGAGGMPGARMVQDALRLVEAALPSHNDHPFSLSAPQTSNLRLDRRSGYLPLDIGFSLNQHKSYMQIQGYPIVDVLAAIGLSHTRPYRDPNSKLRYSYAVARQSGESELYDLSLLRAVLGARKPPIPGMLVRRFQVQLSNPGKDDRCITNVFEITNQRAV